MIVAAAAAALGASAQTPDTLRVERMDMSNPLPLVAPLMIDTVDVNGKKFDTATLIETNRHTSLGYAGPVARGEALTSVTMPSLQRLTFRADVKRFTKDVSVVAPDGAKVYINGTPADAKMNLKPGSYKVEVDMVNTPSATAKADVALAVPAGRAANISIRPYSDAGKRMPSLNDFSDGTHASGLSLSPDGRYLRVNYSTVAPGGRKRDYFSRTFTTADGKPADALTRDNMRWMPVSNLLWATRTADDGTLTLYTVNPDTNTETILATGLPEGNITISPTENFAILTTYTEGPAEGDVYQIIEPEDRQPGWRNRARLWRVDFATGAVTPVTYGYRQLYLNDISNDGTKILVTTQHNRYEKRPTTLRDILSIDLATLSADTIVAGDGFVGMALFSPDASKVLVSGTPESLGGIGLDLPEGRTASMTENELFIIDASDKSVDPITKHFNPSVESASWNAADGRIYFTAEDYDRKPLFVYDPAKHTFTDLTSDREDMVQSYALPVKGNLVAWRGASASNSERVYVTDTRKGSTRMIDYPSADRLADVALGEVKPFEYVTSRGDTIYARYYLPADFDPTRKYPVIVNYYGGCSPTGRNFESRYPHHLYAAQGYAVLVINPSGCTGRGQEWASRHVNTAGEGVAQDIIEGTQQFCRANEWADSTALGCIGASYGGFMTQYLQTQTPMFAAAISHAGISDHTSYWGEGYWGYSYSEVSMANSYPWTRKDIYVDRSPLYLADKINTPLLFLHGDSDNNVPVGESIQMFTALKILGRPTAFVAVADQDHHILDYDKRIKWQDTIFAWFEKYLKHDSTWWDTLYPPKSL